MFINLPYTIPWSAKVIYSFKEFKYEGDSKP